MKFAIKFYKGCRVLENADEIIIKYTKKTSKLIDFVQEWKGHRIIVDVTELDNIEDNLSIFKAAYDIHNSFAIMLLYGQEVVNIAEMNIPFFFIDGVNSLDDLVGQIRLGVSDVYILNELCFNLDKISKLCHDNNVLVRVYPNVAQSASKFPVDNFTKFFIRPDDIMFYKDYIDVIEFYGQLNKQPVLYDIYRDERWLDNLDNIIIGLDKGIDNRTIVPYFGEARAKCQKRCIYSRCDVCGSVANLAGTLKEKGLGLTKGKAKHESGTDEEIMQNESAAVVGSDAEVSE